MTRGAFRHKGFRQLLAAQIPADAADWLDLVAIGALLAFVWEAPPVAFAWFAVAMGLPYLTVGLIAGVYVDRWPLQRTMILANLGRATGTLALILAPDWQVLVAIVALREVADSFFSPAKQAALQALVPVNDLPGANGLSQAINQGSKIVAPALGGVLLAATEPQAVFAINAGFSVAAALLLIRLPDLPRRLKRDITPSVLADLRAGFAMLAARPVLRGCVVVMAASVFAVFFYDTLLAPLIRLLGHDAADFGYLLASVGAGGVAGSLFLVRLHRTSAAFVGVAVAATAGALMTGGLGLAGILGLQPGLTSLLAVFFLSGVGSAWLFVPLRAVLQRETEPELMGRVAALSEAANMGALLLAPFLGVALASISSVSWAFVGGGILKLCVAVLALSLAFGPGHGD